MSPNLNHPWDKGNFLVQGSEGGTRNFSLTPFGIYMKFGYKNASILVLSGSVAS